VKARLDFGAEVDLLCQSELDESLARHAGLLYDYAKGLKWIRRPVNLAGAASGYLAGPRPGYGWMVTLAGLLVTAGSAAGQLELWIGGSGMLPVAVTPVAASYAGPAVVTWSSRQLILNPGEELYAATTTGTLGAGHVQAVEAPAEQVYKLIGG
jgi:hypothetical protein